MKFRLPLPLLLAVIAVSLSLPARGEFEATGVWPSAVEVPADAPLRIGFNAPPTVGNHGRIIVCRAADRTEVTSINLATTEPANDYGGKSLRYQPVLVDGNTATIRLPTHALKEGEAYFVRMEAGVFKDAASGEWAGIEDQTRWNFRTKRALAASPDRLVVAADGSADFCTVQGAVDAVAAGRPKPTTIFIRRGTYDGLVRVPTGKNGLHFLGEDRRGVMLTGTNNDHLNPGVAARALVGVEADDFMLENLTVRNLTPYKGSQAEAVHVRGERCILWHADLYSFQDTLHLDGRAYVEDCRIEGSVDFIWGAASVFFERCELHAVRGGVIIQARTPPGAAGFIFDRCRVMTEPGNPPVYLARIEQNRFPASQVVFLHCQMDDGVRPEGWQVSGERSGELRFAETGTADLAGTTLNVSRRLAGSKQLSPAEAAALASPGAVLGSDSRWNLPVVDAGAAKVPDVRATEQPKVPEVQATGKAKVPEARVTGTAKVYEVRATGAKGDGTSEDSAAIQRALDAAGAAGGGVVRVPAGTFLTRPLFLRSHVTLQLDEGATLRATDEPADFGIGDYPEKGKTMGLINGKDLVDVAITGKGTIDGAGARWWQAFRAVKGTGQPEPRRPRLVCFNGCRGVTVQGVTLKDSPTFHLVPADCEDVTISGVTITAPTDSPNTDGIDPAASRRVTISDCRIDTGDDNIAIKSGHADPAHPNAACANVIVSNCTFLHGHGVSIGSETLGGVSDVLVQNCTFENTRNGLRIKSPRGRGGTVQNIRYRDIRMTNVDSAITITCYYPKVPAQDDPKPMSPDTPVFRNIEIVNLTATCPREAGIIVGLPESPVTGVSLENVHITAKTDLVIRNAGPVKRTNVEITLPATAGH